MYLSRFNTVHHKFELNGMLPELGITFLQKRRVCFEFCDQPGKSITHYYVKIITSLLQENSAASGDSCSLSCGRDDLFGKLGIE